MNLQLLCNTQQSTDHQNVCRSCLRILCIITHAGHSRMKFWKEMWVARINLTICRRHLMSVRSPQDQNLKTDKHFCFQTPLSPRLRNCTGELLTAKWVKSLLQTVRLVVDNLFHLTLSKRARPPPATLCYQSNVNSDGAASHKKRLEADFCWVCLRDVSRRNKAHWAFL